MNCVRDTIEKNEEILFSKFASFSANSKGRNIEEEDCNFRTVFQRDRDRILHSSSFRRLKYKTQVFISPGMDHYRTRLTHTLEVSQIARTICRALNLNEDLVEAMALGHDLGHAPFGHAGERSLNEICNERFVHAIQSLRVVKVLEKDGKGLNLTKEVLDGIECHSAKESETLEGRVLKISDKIAYINHDIEDSIKANIISNFDIPKLCIDVLGKTKSDRITTMISSIVENSVDKNDIIMNIDVLNAHKELKKFMFITVYRSNFCLQEEIKVFSIIEKLYNYFKTNKDKLPKFYINSSEIYGIDRCICDFISGMTDRYAVNLYNNIFIPKDFIGII